MSEATLDSPQGIAIVGMSGRFPAAPDLDRFWENLRGGVEAVSFFTDEELAAAGVEPAQLADPLYVKARGVLRDIELFDPAFFGFTPREAELLDPQHRAFLECSWEALESAGYDPERFPGRIAVYGGAGSNSYVLNNLLPNEELLRKVGGLQVVLMNQGDFLTTRVSYKLNLRGPSVLVQTACSTALVAVHMGCQSLLAGEVDMALAGGVSIDVPQVSGYFYQEAGVASPDGRCRAFDERAAGTVGGSGAGVVVLKRLEDALADGDTIHAVIKGSAINNDGSAKVGFTAPSVEGQAEAIAESLLMAGFEPDTIGYVEAHGSGTALGDPVEIAALTQAFRAGTEGTGFCAVGSVKASVGHCNAAAGIAGLLKTVLALKHGEIPPSLHFERPNPRIDFAGSPFYVNARLSLWPDQPGQEVRRAGVSSFGLGGTNAHVVLEEAPPAEAPEPSLRPAQLLTLSARTASALERAEANLDGFLRSHPDVGIADIADIAHTLQVGRRAFEHRRAWLVRDGREVAAASGVCEANAARPVVFLFPGLGDQYVDMARELYEVEPTFRETFDLCADLLAPYLDLDLRRVLFSEGGAVPRSGSPGLDLKALLRRDGRADNRLSSTEVAQPTHFAVEYSLARLLMEWGIVPEAMIGYSIGEYVAACLAGALSLEDAILLVARRAKLIQDLPGGAMLAVPLPEAEVRPLLPERLSVAATNGPHLTVVGGPSEAVAEFERSLGERGVSSITLRTTHAFHTEMMEPAVAALTEIARRVEAHPPSIPYLSNVTGTWIAAEDLADPGYWARHMRGTVRFAEGLAELLGKPERLLVEIGPGGTLGTLARQHPLAPAGLVTVSALPGPGEGRSDEEHLLAALGRLWAAGAEVDWNGFAAHERRRRVPLPTYPFERQRCWIDPPRGGARAALPAVQTAESADLADWFYLPVWKQAAPARPAVSSRQGERWLVIPDAEGFGGRLSERLRREGAEVVSDASAHPTHVLHLAALTRDEPSADEALEKGLVRLVLLQQALAQSEAPVRLAVAANHLAEVVDGDLVVPAKAALLGACKVVHQESPRLTCGALDVLLPEPGSPAEERLIGQILSEMDGELLPVIAYRGRQRWGRGFEPVRLGPVPASPLVEEGVYLITDGAHGVGPALAEFLTQELRARVILGLPSDLASLGRLDGVFHTAGSSAGGLLQLKTAEGLAAALGPVARGTEELFAALGDAGAEPAFVALCSSTLAFSGGLGQLESAATGSLLDAVAQRRTAEGDGPRTPRTLAVHWDPYQWGGWLAAGVGSALVPGFGQEQMQKNLDAFVIPAGRSGEALRRLLASPLPRAAVSARDLSSLIAETDAFTLDAFLSQMEGARSAETHRREGLSTPYEPPRGETEERLAGLWQELFGIDRIGIHDDFLELGGHSLLAIQLMTQIRTAFEVDLPLPTLFESPTVAQLAAVIDGERGDELERLLAAVEGLSPEEALQRMSEL
jgi:acyl transferase domain-containing protein/acyl carrier protein